MTPQQALYAATVTPATFFNVENEIGQIGPGMRADLVLLQNNPLTNIQHTEALKR